MGTTIIAVILVLAIGLLAYAATRPDAFRRSGRREEDGERGLETLVTIIFAEQDGGTLMSFLQTPFRYEGEREGYGRGWNSTFDRLGGYLKQPED